MKNKIRLLLILSNGDLGGGQETVRLLVQHLNKEIFSVSVVCPESPTMERLRQIPSIQLIPLSFPTIPRWSIVKRLADIIRQDQPNIVHTHLFMGDLYGFLATRMVRVPRLVSTIQGINFHWEMEHPPRRFRWRILAGFYRWIYRFFHGIAACSEAVKKAVSSRPGIKVPAEKIQVIHNSIDISQVQQLSQQKSADHSLTHRNGHGLKRIITVANFAPFKGHMVLLRALSQITNNIPIECVFIGDGPERRCIEKAAQEMGLTDKIRFLGYRRDVPAFVRDSDLFVFPSLWEPFGIAVLEAMSLSVPVVACSAGGVPEILKNDETGILVAPNDPTALSDGIQRLISDPVLAQRLASEAQRTVKMFDVSRMAKSYEQWYEKILMRN